MRTEEAADPAVARTPNPALAVRRLRDFARLWQSRSEAEQNALVVAALGLEPQELIADEFDVCQGLATAARAAGFDGILGPSAAQ